MTTDRSPNLILISQRGEVPSGPPLPPSLPRLTREVVQAARNYAEALFASAEAIDQSTPEGELRLALLDAVQDLETAEINAAALSHGGVQQSLFG